MRKLKDALRLELEGGLSHSQIAIALGISKGVCWCRLNSEPPCRFNIEPGLDAVRRTSVCG